MLALELCLVDSAPVPTLVFDEIDAGIGGRAAVEVGRRLARLGRQRQVLAVTHLAQVAAFADRHVVVGKQSVVDKPASSAASVTASDVRVVTDADRVTELARMLAGSDSATARDHAAELLSDADVERSQQATKAS
jgi:DNA repair protein RecN (Recombination protein N)